MQHYFRNSPVRHIPAGLDPEKVDHYFVEDLCRLNLDETFFKGIERDNTDSLHAFLVRYLILYFDNEFAPGALWDDFIRDFMSRRRFHRPPSSRAASMSEKEACKHLRITTEVFKGMDRHALTRCYRRLAKETHPDSGGDGESFILVKEAYECLLKSKA